MNSQHRAIRVLLQEMGPRRAENYIQAFDLRDDESMYIIEREVRRKSIQQIASAHNVSAETGADQSFLHYLCCHDAVRDQGHRIAVTLF